MNTFRNFLRYFSLPILAALLLAVLLPFSVPAVKSAGGTFGGGDGSASTPYLIEDIDDLQSMNNNLTAYYKLANDIDASATSLWSGGTGFVPIGGGGTENLFTGNFDGDYHTITGLYINRPTTLNVGLFGHVGQGAVIRNVKLATTTVTGQRGVGTLIGRVTGNVNTLTEQCSSIGGTVTGNGATGGLIGSHNSVTETAGGTNNPIASYCFADVDVVYSAFSLVGADDKGDKIGGLAGCNQKGTITNSFARGSVTHTGGAPTVAERIAGLAGCVAFRGNVVNSYSTGLVTVDGDRIRFGGLVGYLGTGGNAGTVTNSFWDTQTSGQATSAGTGATGKTTVEMKTEATFTAAGWDFTGIWGIDGTEAKKVLSFID